MAQLASAVRVGEVILGLRLRRAFARPALARLVGVSSNYLGMVEAGKRTLSLSTLDRIAAVLGVSSALILCAALPLPWKDAKLRDWVLLGRALVE